MSGARLQWWLGRAALLAALLAYFFLLRRYSAYDLGTEWVDADVGQRAAQAVRMLDGAVPYRDFWAHYPPLPYYTNALLFRMFGLRLSAFRIALAVVGVATVFLTYVVARRLACRTAALAAAALALSWSVPDLNVNYNTWYCVPLALAALWCTLVALDSHRLGPWLLVGLLGGFVLGFKVNYGLFVITAIGIVILANQQSRQSALPRYLGAALLAAAGLGGFVLIRQAFAPATLLYFALPLAACALWAGLAARAPGERRSAWPRLGMVAVGVAVTLIPWTVYFAVQWEASAFLSHVFLGFVRYGESVALPPSRPTFRTVVLAAWLAAAGCLALWRARPAAWRCFAAAVGGAGVFVILAWPTGGLGSYQRWLYALVADWVHVRGFVPIAAIWAALLLLWPRRRNPADHLPLFALTVTAAAVMLTWYPYSDVNHLQWCWPVVAILACVLVDRFISAAGPGARAWWLVPFGIAAVQWFALATHFARPEVQDGPWITRTFEHAAPPRGDVLVPSARAAAVGGAVQYIRSTTASHAPIFELYGALLGFLAERPNPTRYDYFWPGWLDEAEQRAVIETLAANPPAYVIGHKRNAADDPMARFTEYFPLLGEYLAARYGEERLIGPYQFYTRRAPAAAS